MTEPTHFERLVKKYNESKRKLQIALDDDPNGLKIDTAILKLQHSRDMKSLADMALALFQAGALKEVEPEVEHE